MIELQYIKDKSSGVEMPQQMLKILIQNLQASKKQHHYNHWEKLSLTKRSRTMGGSIQVDKESILLQTLHYQVGLEPMINYILGT